MLELRNDWKERWEVVGRENEKTIAGCLLLFSSDDK